MANKSPFDQSKPVQLCICPNCPFVQLPPEARSKLLDMLCQSGVESPEWWWWDVLVGEGDPLYRELEAI
ncbi:MAG: hypothetical protein IKG22_09610 [Atopobiaceae bacterium]|nr:hypothetical protein [Atopobiaceae bacterium]